MPSAAARADAGTALAVSALVVLPFGRVVEIPVMLMALLGLWALARRPGEMLKPAGARLLGALFLCTWVPMVLSLPDSVNVGRTLEVVLNHLRFWLGGLFLVQVLATARARRLFFTVAAAVLALWVADALLQYATGHDLLGYEAWPRRLGGLFGPGNTKFGLTLATFAALLWHVAAQRLGRLAAAIALAASIVVVFLAYSRAGWITVLVAAATWLLLRASTSRAAMRRAAVAIVLGGALGLGSAYGLSDYVRGRVDQGLAAFHDNADIHNSVVHRIWIWGAALRMIQAHPVNGVGARNFRVAFQRFARADDPYLRMDPPQRPTHSHQLLLEVASETGLIGIAGLVTLWVLLARSYLHAVPDRRRDLAPFAAALAGAYFPLNTHLAIYSSYWSQIVWYLIGLYCAWLGAAQGRSSDSSSAASEARTEAMENQRS